jgi:transposase
VVQHRTALKHRIHASLMTFGHLCPVSDLFGIGGRQLLERLQFPEPWRGDIEASLRLVHELGEELGEEIAEIDKSLRAAGADHPSVPLLMSVPGVDPPPSQPRSATSPAFRARPSSSATPA